MEIEIVDTEYTIDKFIKDLQSLSPTLRSKPIVVRAENGMLFRPEVKQLLKDDKNIFGGWENVAAAIITV